MKRRALVQAPAGPWPAKVEFRVSFSRNTRGRKQGVPGGAGSSTGVGPIPLPPEAAPTPVPPDVPKVTQLLVVAYWWETLIAQGKIRDYAEIARLTGLSRARVTQIADLRLLAACEQEVILTHSLK